MDGRILPARFDAVAVERAHVLAMHVALRLAAFLETSPSDAGGLHAGLAASLRAASASLMTHPSAVNLMVRSRSRPMLHARLSEFYRRQLLQISTTTTTTRPRTCMPKTGVGSTGDFLELGTLNALCWCTNRQIFLIMLGCGIGMCASTSTHRS